MIKHHVMSKPCCTFQLSITQNPSEYCHTHTRLVNHVALFANRTMNQKKQEKKEIRVYKAGYRYL